MGANPELDKAWGKMPKHEKRRLETRVMHKYTKLMNKEAIYNIDSHLNKISNLEHHIFKMLDNTKIT